MRPGMFPVAYPSPSDKLISCESGCLSSRGSILGADTHKTQGSTPSTILLVSFLIDSIKIPRQKQLNGEQAYLGAL